MNLDDTLDTQATNETRTRTLLAQVLIYLGLCLSVGSAAAAVGIAIEEGLQLIPSLVVGAIVVAGFAMMVVGVRIGGLDAPNFKSKTDRAQLILAVSGGLGALIGFYAVITGMGGRFYDGDFTISRLEAIIALVVIFVVILPMAVLRERNADDFEKAAAKDAAYWAFSAYLYGYMGWSIAYAGGLLPALNSGYMFLVLLFLFMGIWAFKRSG